MTCKENDPFGNKKMERVKSLPVPEGYREIDPTKEVRLGGGHPGIGEIVVGAPFSRTFRQKEG